MAKRRFDLTDLGYLYHGPASPAMKSEKFEDWTIIDIPSDVDTAKAKVYVFQFLNNVCAIEIPSSLVCNLRCTYCYITDPRMKCKHVSRDVVRKIIETSAKLFPKLRKPNSTIHITPWGAEPVCNIDTLEEIYESGKRLFGEYFRTSTSTNGTIWNERLERLFESLLKEGHLNDLQISLDGPEWVQNRYRPFLDGRGSFDKVKEFTLAFRDLCSKLSKTGVDHFCSTIHVSDEKYVEAWRDAAIFFTEPDTWHFAPSLPMRVSALDFDKEENCYKFIEAQKQTHEVIKRRVKEGIPCCDFYTHKLFMDVSCRSRNSFSYCSAMNSQIGIDIDGSIYLCHGPITTPRMKPLMWLGNIFDKVISYQKIIRNMSWMYNVHYRSKCVTCPLHYYTTGNICWSCPPHNMDATGEPSIDYIQKCPVYCECFKYWFANALMIVRNPILDKIPRDAWFTKGIDYDNLPQIPDEQKMVVPEYDCHFDPNYDGLLMHAIRRYTGSEPEHNVYLCGDWWRYFDYFESIVKGRM